MCCSAKPLRPGETGKCMVAGLLFVAASFALSDGWPRLGVTGVNVTFASMAVAVLAISLGWVGYRRIRPGAACDMPRP